MIKIKIVKANFGLRIFIFPYNISMKHLNIHIDFFERNGEKILEQSIESSMKMSELRLLGQMAPENQLL